MSSYFSTSVRLNYCVWYPVLCHWYWVAAGSGEVMFNPTAKLIAVVMSTSGGRSRGGVFVGG